jgi:hypothetical protein
LTVPSGNRGILSQGECLSAPQVDRSIAGGKL